MSDYLLYGVNLGDISQERRKIEDIPEDRFGFNISEISKKAEKCGLEAFFYHDDVGERAFPQDIYLGILINAIYTFERHLQYDLEHLESLRKNSSQLLRMLTNFGIDVKLEELKLFGC